jgi:hypothetical protein
MWVSHSSRVHDSWNWHYGPSFMTDKVSNIYTVWTGSIDEEQGHFPVQSQMINRFSDRPNNTVNSRFDLLQGVFECQVWTQFLRLYNWGPQESADGVLFWLAPLVSSLIDLKHDSFSILIFYYWSQSFLWCLCQHQLIFVIKVSVPFSCVGSIAFVINDRILTAKCRYSIWLAALP